MLEMIPPISTHFQQALLIQTGTFFTILIVGNTSLSLVWKILPRNDRFLYKLKKIYEVGTFLSLFSACRIWIRNKSFSVVLKDSFLCTLLLFSSRTSDIIQGLDVLSGARGLNSQNTFLFIL